MPVVIDESTQCPAGYVYSPVLGRCSCSDHELKGAQLAYTERMAESLDQALPDFLTPHIGVWATLSRLAILLTPKEFIHAPGDQNLILYPSPLGYTLSDGGSPVNLTDPDTNEADTSRIRKQLDALVAANYDYLEGASQPTPLLPAVATLIFALAGSMLELDTAKAWPAFQLDRGVGAFDHNSIRQAVVKPSWLVQTGQVVGGKNLPGCELLTALGGKLFPYLEHEVLTISGTQKVDTFRLLMAFINIVASRYELTSDPGQ